MMKMKKLFMGIITILFSLVLAVGCQFFQKPQAETVTVGFDLNFRTVMDDPENIEVTPGEAYGTLPTIEVENEGYTFVGWNTKANGKGDTITEDSIVAEDAEDHTLYAIWQGKTYTVSYELNGGTVNGATTLPTQTVTFGSMYGAMVIPSDPEKPLSEFLGWYLNADGTGAPVSYSSDVRTAKDHTLYAIYRDLRMEYDFSTADQLNDFVNVDHAGMEIVEDANGNYLKLTPINFEADTPAADLYSIFMLKTPLKAGQFVEIDCEVVGDIVDAWGLWTWGAMSTGDIQFDGQKVTKWETPVLWNGGKFTSTTEITENCAGLRIQFRYVGNADAYWKVTGIRIKDAGDTPTIPPVAETRTEYDFTTEDQINYFGKEKNVTYSIVDGYLKVVGTVGSESTLTLVHELKAGQKVTVDVEYVGENLAYADGNQITFLTYGANVNGHADGNTYAVIGNAKWDGGWDCAKVRTVSEIVADCAGLRMQFVMNSEEGAYFKITNIKVYEAGEEVEELPTPENPDTPVIPDEPVVNTRTEYDFTTEDQINDFGKEKNVTYAIVDGYLKVVGTAGSESTLVLTRELKAGQKVTVDVEYVGTNLAYADGQITFVTYGANAAGDSDGNTYAVMGNAKWDGGWDCAKVRTVSEIVADCVGLRMQFVMNGDEGAYFKITNIKIYEEGETVEELPTPPVEPDVPVIPEEPEVELRKEYDFTTADQINDFGKEKNVTYSIVDGYLKVVGTAGSESTLVLTRELKAGQKVTVDVAYVATNVAYASGNQITFVTYGANAAGDSDGNTYAVMGNAKWDGGWDCAKVRTVSEIVADCAGLRMQFVMNGEDGAYFKITNIKIYEAGEEVEELPTPENPDTPVIPDEPVVNTRTEYDFTTEDQKNEFASVSNGIVEINTAEGYLKLSPEDKTITTDNMPQAEFVYNKTLTAGMIVKIEFKLVGAINVGHGIWMYGVNENGHSLFDGAYYTAWDTPNDWNNGEFTATFEVTQDCAGIKFLVRFAKNADAYWKIEDMRITEKTSEPVEPDTPVVPDEPAVIDRTEYDFTTEDQKNEFASLNNGIVEINTAEGYLKFSPEDKTITTDNMPQAEFVYNRALTAGMQVKIEFELVGAINVGHGIWTYGVNENGHNLFEGAYYTAWDKPNDWNNGKFTVTFEVAQDCAGIKFLVRFAKNADAYWKIESMRITEETGPRTTYDFTTADQIDAFGKAKRVDYAIVDGYLKVTQTSNEGSNILVLQQELAAGKVVEIDVEYVGQNLAYADGQITFLAYTANAAGDPDGKNDVAIGNAKWDGGWDCGKTTVSVAVTEDCAGIRMQFVFNSEAGAYFKITAIRIVDAQ